MTAAAGMWFAALTLAACAGHEARPLASVAGYEPASVERMHAAGWKTNLSRLDVALPSISLSTLPRDAFVPIRVPAYDRASALALPASEPVVAIQGERELRAWPLAWLRARELVLDEFEGRAIAVTFCSLCSTTRVWSRTVGSTDLDLAVSGMLLDGNSLLFDRETESLWRQIDGRAVAGHHCGSRLTALPSFVISFGELVRARPDAQVMARPPAGREPPLRWLTAAEVERGVPPEWLSVSCPSPLEPVLAIEGVDRLLPTAGPSVEQVGPAVVFRDPAAALPFPDPDGGSGPVTGAAIAFRSEVDGQPLTFRANDGEIHDRETESRWDRMGRAIEGPLSGRQLVPLEHVLGFRFALSPAESGR